MNVLIFLFLVLAGSLSPAGTETHGGDARRFRAQLAKIQIMQGMKDFLAIMSDPGIRALCDRSPNLDFSRLVERAPEILWAIPRSKAVWDVGPEQNDCLTIETNFEGQALLFSYYQCPLPTPNNYYLDKIFSALQDLRNPQTSGLQKGSKISTSTLLAALELNEGCRTLLGRPPIMPMTKEIKTEIFTSERAAALALERSRLLAVRLLENLNANTIDTMPEVIRDFILRNHSAILDDIRNTPYFITPMMQTTCATTRLSQGEPIYFSPEHCIDFQTELDVAWLILHETAHHFGIEAENFADFFAIGVIRASLL
jgi:hypothetical protein